MPEKIYKRRLPAGWYPVTAEETTNIVDVWQTAKKNIPARACVVPHAGWFYSGEIAFKVLSSINSKPDTIIIAGGHLSELDRISLYWFDAFETPVGNLYSEKSLLDYFHTKTGTDNRDVTDNSVEIQLPFVKYCFPEAKVMCMRLPPNQDAIHAAEIIHSYESEYGKKILVIGSTDLTHYGDQYGFKKNISTKAALEWAKNENDKQFLKACTTFDYNGILQEGLLHRAACSAGAALCAAHFAALHNLHNAKVLNYGTSYNKNMGDSFVSYAGIVYF